MASPIYRIKQWDEIYEWTNSRLRPTDPMKWVKLPTKQGDGYRKLVTHRRGSAHYGAWAAMLRIAAMCFPRGVLVDSEGRGLTAVAMAKRSFLPSRDFDELIPRLLDENDVGWIEVVTSADVATQIADIRERVRVPAPTRVQDARTDLSNTNSVLNSTEGRKRIENKRKKTEVNARNLRANSTETPSTTRQPARPIDDAYLDELQASEEYKMLDVRRELGKCQQWCKVRNKIASRRRFINWLNNADQPLGSNSETDRGSDSNRNQRPSAVDRRSSTLHRRNYEELAKRSRTIRPGKRDDSTPSGDRSTD